MGDLYIDSLVRRYGRRAYLGAGQRGDVFAHPTHADVVVKMFEYDPAYELYVKWARTHGRRNPYSPKIYAFERKTDKSTSSGYRNFVFVERMRPVSSTAIMQFVRHVFPQCTWQNPVYTLSRIDWRRVRRVTPDEHFGDVLDFLLSSKQTLDLVQFNIMRRECGQIVLSDPLRE